MAGWGAARCLTLHGTLHFLLHQLGVIICVRSRGDSAHTGQAPRHATCLMLPMPPFNPPVNPLEHSPFMWDPNPNPRLLARAVPAALGLMTIDSLTKRCNIVIRREEGRKAEQQAHQVNWCSVC